jgi:hypothetical protein
MERHHLEFIKGEVMFYQRWTKITQQMPEHGLHAFVDRSESCCFPGESTWSARRIHVSGVGEVQTVSAADFAVMTRVMTIYVNHIEQTGTIKQTYTAWIKVDDSFYALGDFENEYPFSEEWMNGFISGTPDWNYLYEATEAWLPQEGVSRRYRGY